MTQTKKAEPETAPPEVAVDLVQAETVKPQKKTWEAIEHELTKSFGDLLIYLGEQRKAGAIQDWQIENVGTVLRSLKKGAVGGAFVQINNQQGLIEILIEKPKGQ